jgi:hypothetical protein
MDIGEDQVGFERRGRGRRPGEVQRQAGLPVDVFEEGSDRGLARARRPGDAVGLV